VTDTRLNHQVQLFTGVMKEECSALLKEFFKQLRKDKKTLPEDIK
jgi:tRNA(adenine34) deaminase